MIELLLFTKLLFKCARTSRFYALKRQVFAFILGGNLLRCVLAHEIVSNTLIFMVFVRSNYRFAFDFQQILSNCI